MDWNWERALVGIQTLDHGCIQTRSIMADASYSKKRKRDAEVTEDCPLHVPRGKKSRRRQRQRPRQPLALLISPPPSVDTTKNSSPKAAACARESSETATPRTPPQTPAFEGYDPDFGRKVSQAFEIAQGVLVMQQRWREARYGTDIASRYSRGNTPDMVRKECERREDDAVRRFEDELESTDDESDCVGGEMEQENGKRKQNE